METNDKIKRGIQVFGAILIAACLGGFIWSNCGPHANDPLTPEEERRLEDLREHTFKAAPVQDASAD